MSVERMNVSLDDFFCYLIRKWYMIAGSIFVSSIIFCTATIVFGQKIEVPPSEEYLYLKEQEASFQDYIDHSIVMKMDSVNIYERTLFLKNISNKEVLKDFVESGSVWENNKEDIAVQYLTEILSWEENIDTVEIRIRHNNEVECGKYAEYLAEQLRHVDDSLEISMGQQRVVVDEAMAKRQTWYINRLNDIQGQLEYTAMGYTIEVSITTALILGVLFGGFFAFVVLFCFFLFDNKLRSIDEISYYTKSDLIAKCDGINAKKHLPVVGTDAFEEMIKERFGQKEKVLLINMMGKSVQKYDFFEVDGSNIENCQNDILNYEYIVIAASPNKTVYKELKMILKYLAENEKEVSGCIAC